MALGIGVDVRMTPHVDAVEEGLRLEYVQQLGCAYPRGVMNLLSKHVDCRRIYLDSSIRRRNPHQQHVLDILEDRGLVHQIAGDRNILRRLFQTKKIGVYSGIDPTAPSLHLGHLLPLMVLFWLYHHGHHTISLIGGGTARVGDPSGRLTSRARASGTTQQTNARAISAQLEALWENASSYAVRHGLKPEARGTQRLLDNASWLRELSVLEFLDVMGSGMRMGTMLGRETVKNKMEKGDGMSFAEFSYPLLQGWDWWRMYRDHNVLLQVGGGDQYGNIVAGMEAVRYAAQDRRHHESGQAWLDDQGKLRLEQIPTGLTVPLLTTSSGAKFGKSAGNALWLDRKMTPAFDLYGFLVSTADADVERYLKLFTFLPLSHISELMAAQKNRPEQREAQHKLASEVLELVYGADVSRDAQASHRTSRRSVLATMTQSNSSSPTEGPKLTGLERVILPSSLVLNVPLSRLLFHAGMVSSRSEGARLIAQGGVYVGVQRATSDVLGSEDATFLQLKQEDSNGVNEFVHQGFLLLRIGKWKVRLIEIADDSKAAKQ